MRDALPCNPISPAVLAKVRPDGMEGSSMIRIRVLGALAATIVLVGAGCGGDDSEAPLEPEPGATTEEPEAEDEPGEEEPTAEESPEDDEAADATVAVAEAGPGTILVDGAGMSLYMYDPDAQGPSTCYDDCATQWPPLVVEADPVAGDGVDAALLSTVERDDGTTQVTYDGWPLYAWAQDSASGDTTGQGVGGVWWVIGPDGAPIR
jgi:predicted lipoprotein with Yx(FWY)xxD motif